MEIEWAEVLYTEPEEGDAFRSHQQGSKESRGLQILQCYCDTPKTRESLFTFPIDMKTVIQILCFFLLITFYKCAVITGACEKDLQCGPGTCCAISLWLRGLRMCTPLGQEGDECHPFSHKIPFFGKRQHHACPCLPNFICSKFTDGRYRCSINFKNIDF